MSDGQQSIGQHKPTRVRWAIFICACLTSWFLYLHRFTFLIIGPKLKEEYGFSETEMGGLFSAFNITYGIGQLPSGILCDFYGPHLFLGAIIAIWSLSLPLLGLTGDLKMLTGCRLLFGMGQAGAYPSLTKVTQVWFAKSKRTIAQGWVATFFGRGGGAMAPIILATILMGHFELSWRVSIAIMGGSGLFFAALFLVLVRNSPNEDLRVNDAERELIHEGLTNETSEDRKILPVGQALRNPSVCVFVAQQFANAGADNFFGMLTGAYFLSRGVDMASVGILASLPLFGGAIGGMLGGYYNDVLMKRTGHRRVVRSVVGFSGKFIAFCMIFVAITQESAIAAGLGMFVVKFFSDWTQPTVWGTCTDLGGRFSATVFSIINTSGTLGGIFCPLLFGYLLDYYTTPQGVNYMPVFIAVSGLYLISAGCWFFINCSDSLDKSEKEAAAALEKPQCGVLGVIDEFLRMLLPLATGLTGIVLMLAKWLPIMEGVDTANNSLWWTTLLKTVGYTSAVGLAAGIAGYGIAKVVVKIRANASKAD